MRFFFLSVRDPKTDFRRDLVAALRQLGHRVTYIRLARYCFVDDVEFEGDQARSPLKVAWWMFKTNFSKQRVVIFNTVNLGFPVFCTLLRLLSWRAVWCFDLHDDLLYDLSGSQRLIARAKLAWHQMISSFSVRAAPTLRELHPRSRSLCNASFVERASRPRLDWTRILIFSNIDRRFDFDLVEGIVQQNPDFSFHVHGGIVRDPIIEAAFRHLTQLTNVTYYGTYASPDIASILERYDITLAPYRIDRSTRYIDPLRYYHCLNSGLEIITSPIPRALDMRECMHIISSAEEFRPLIAALQSGAVKRKNGDEREAKTWTDRATELLDLLSDEQVNNVRLRPANRP
jgi:hypothetical protein